VKTGFAESIAAALQEVAAADREIARLLRGIRVAPRASKTTISEALQDALARLRRARESLLDLQKLAAT
jgi:hypothetical protein